jgi:predicted HNH restriction endonuclease
VLDGRGVRVLQVHHRKQLSAREAPSITKLGDLAVVCANCHLLLHLDPKNALKVEKLREMLEADGFL